MHSRVPYTTHVPHLTDQRGPEQTNPGTPAPSLAQPAYPCMTSPHRTLRFSDVSYPHPGYQLLPRISAFARAPLLTLPPVAHLPPLPPPTEPNPSALPLQKDGSMAPGAKGLALNPDQWRRLAPALPGLLEAQRARRLDTEAVVLGGSRMASLSEFK